MRLGPIRTWLRGRRGGRVQRDRKEIIARLAALAGSERLREWLELEQALSIPERVFATAWEIDAALAKGGFNTYFFNPSGRRAPEAPIALRTVGATGMATIAAAAVAMIGLGFAWANDESRQQRLLTLSAEEGDRLERLGDQFRHNPDDLPVLLDEYVWEHRKQFGVPSIQETLSAIDRA